MTRAICQECEGSGSETVATHTSPPEQQSCGICKGTGKIQVGVFDPICARHCHLCEGQDHHWSYDGDEDEEGEPLMGCRHCPALREFTQDDDDNADY